MILSYCDKSGNMVLPWAEAGYKCICVDLQKSESQHENIKHVQADVKNYLPPLETYEFFFAFPPCTHTAVSGARWFKSKGPGAAVEAFEILAACIKIADWIKCPWMIENPVSTFSTYWRKPDYTFQPWQFGDNYTKKTCIWHGNGAIMPEPDIKEMPADCRDYIHKLPPSDNRAELRSITPMGFARAVFNVNRGTK